MGKSRPYYGAHLYGKRTVRYLLHHRIVALEDVKGGIRATTTFPLGEYEKAFRQIKSVIGDVTREAGERRHT